MRQRKRYDRERDMTEKEMQQRKRKNSKNTGKEIRRERKRKGTAKEMIEAIKVSSIKNQSTDCHNRCKYSLILSCVYKIDHKWCTM